MTNWLFLKSLLPGLMRNRRVGTNVLTLAILLALTLGLPTVTHADIYTYTGSPLAQDPSVPTSITGLTNIGGSLTISGALAPNLADSDITGLITSFSFSDGLQTITQANATTEDFVVNTNSSGNIIGWAVALGTAGGSILSCKDLGQIDPYPPSGYCEPGTGFGGTGDEVQTQGEVGLVVPGNGSWATPEPSILPMLGAGLAAMFGIGALRKRLALA